MAGGNGLLYLFLEDLNFSNKMFGYLTNIKIKV
jgi:hypothetical protein